MQETRQEETTALLRPYQIEAVNEIKDKLEKRPLMLVASRASEKSTAAALVAYRATQSDQETIVVTPVEDETPVIKLSKNEENWNHSAQVAKKARKNGFTAMAIHMANAAMLGVRFSNAPAVHERDTRSPEHVAELKRKAEEKRSRKANRKLKI